MSKLPPIKQLLPHDEPMILLDRAMDIQEDAVFCQVDISIKNPFFDHNTNSVPSYVGIEFMAQAVAAWSGYHALKNKQPPPVGFLLGSRRYETNVDAFQQGETLDVYAEKLLENSSMGVFSARLELAAQTVASCQLNVYIPSDEQLQNMKIRSQ